MYGVSLFFDFEKGVSMGFSQERSELADRAAIDEFVLSLVLAINV